MVPFPLTLSDPNERPMIEWRWFPLQPQEITSEMTHFTCTQPMHLRRSMARPPSRRLLFKCRYTTQLNSTQREFTDAGETPHCPHLLIKIKYKTIRHILLVGLLIYLQSRLGRL